jgi:hypothetical protein
MCISRTCLVAPARSSWRISPTSLAETVPAVLEASAAGSSIIVNVHLIFDLRESCWRRARVRKVCARWYVLHIDIEQSAISLVMVLVLLEHAGFNRILPFDC